MDDEFYQMHNKDSIHKIDNHTTSDSYIDNMKNSRSFTTATLCVILRQWNILSA